MKYPLTDTAKEAARILAYEWGGNPDFQGLKYFTQQDADGERTMLKVPGGKMFPSVRRNSLQELNRFGLIELNTTNHEVLLLQELLDTVANDFEVSDYFRSHDTQALAQSLREVLGQNLLREHSELAQAINQLSKASDSDKKGQAEKVFKLLTSSLGSVADATAIGQALAMIFSVASGM